MYYASTSHYGRRHFRRKTLLLQEILRTVMISRLFVLLKRLAHNTLTRSGEYKILH